MELKHLEFREEVLKKEKQLLAKFASHISTIHSIKVLNDANNSFGITVCSVFHTRKLKFTVVHIGYIHACNPHPPIRVMKVSSNIIMFIER